MYESVRVSCVISDAENASTVDKKTVRLKKILTRMRMTVEILNSAMRNDTVVNFSFHLRAIVVLNIGRVIADLLFVNLAQSPSFLLAPFLSFNDKDLNFLTT